MPTAHRAQRDLVPRPVRRGWRKATRSQAQGLGRAQERVDHWDRSGERCSDRRGRPTASPDARSCPDPLTLAPGVSPARARPPVGRGSRLWPTAEPPGLPRQAPALPDRFATAGRRFDLGGDGSGHELSQLLERRCSDQPIQRVDCGICARRTKSADAVALAGRSLRVR